MKRKLYYIDDDKQNLEVFRLLFAGDYEVMAFSNANLFLQEIDDHDIEVLFVDFKMPTMSGLDLIRQVKQSYPKAVCLLLSGYVEPAIMSDPLVDGFVRKPYDIEKLFTQIADAFKAYDQKAD